jgi:hypothetical protein
VVKDPELNSHARRLPQHPAQQSTTATESVIFPGLGLVRPPVRTGG